MTKSLVWAVLALSSLASATVNCRNPPPVQNGTNSTSHPLYKDPNASVDARIADLLSRMSIEDKAAQLVQGDVSNWIDTTTGAFNESGLEFNMKYRASSFYVGYPAQWSILNKGIKIGQEYLANNTNLTVNIPAFVQSEGIHGFLLPNATIFNSPVGYACSFNPELVQKMARAIAQEALALGVNQLFAPLGDLAREPRYGRYEECFSEDPYLAGEMAYSYVVGLQSGNVSATVKHFAAYASPEQGINTSPVHGGRRELLTTYLPSFKRAIIDASAYSVMSAYHCYDGIPAVADSYMLTKILRDDWGYKYWVTSDAGGTDRLCTAFSLCQASPIDSQAIVSMALPAGGDAEMGGGSYNYQKIPEMVAAGKLDEKIVDTAVSRVLRAKFEMGLFEHSNLGVPDDELDKYIHTNETVALARQLDAESIVLLENHNNVLPLKKDANIAVIGPMAHGFMNYGDYVPYLSQYRGVTPLDGIQAAATGKVTYAKGCERWSNDESGFAEAVSTAEAADVAVVVVGTWSRDQNELWAGLNATTGEHIDVSSLDLVGAMPRLVETIIKTGKPTIVVFSSGKPVTEPWISTNASALVQQFYPSEQGGNALADVLFGDVNPSGKLSVTVPHTIAAAPLTYDALNSARSWTDAGQILPDGTLKFGFAYVLDSPLPLYEFGYGLSYSNFTYSNLKLSSTTVSQNDTITLSVDVANTSQRDGAEVIQVYVKDVVSSVVVPNIRLKGFKKVLVKAGATETVSIDLKVADWGLWDANLEYRVEPGQFGLYVGRSSQKFVVQTTVTVS